MEYLKSSLSIKLLILLCIVTQSSAQISGDTFANAQLTKKAKISYVYIHTEGFSEKTGNNVSGICPDIMDLFFDHLYKKYGIIVEKEIHHRPEDYEFNKLLQEVEKSKGGVFGLGNITITNERKNRLDFSPPFLENLTLIISHSSVPTLKRLEDLPTLFGNMRAIASAGTTNESEIIYLKENYFPELVIHYEPSQAETLRILIEDNKTFTNLDFAYFLAALKEKLPVKMHTAGNRRTENFGIAMPKNSDWQKPLNEFLTEEFRNSAEYRKVISNHLGSNALQLLDNFSKKPN